MAYGMLIEVSKNSGKEGPALMVNVISSYISKDESLTLIKQAESNEVEADRDEEQPEATSQLLTEIDLLEWPSPNADGQHVISSVHSLGIDEDGFEYRFIPINVYGLAEHATTNEPFMSITLVQKSSNDEAEASEVFQRLLDEYPEHQDVLQSCVWVAKYIAFDGKNDRKIYQFAHIETRKRFRFSPNPDGSAGGILKGVDNAEDLDSADAIFTDIKLPINV